MPSRQLSGPRYWSGHLTAYGVDEETRTEFSSVVEFGFRLLAVSSLTYVYNTPKVTGYFVALFPLTRLKTSKTGEHDAISSFWLIATLRVIRYLFDLF